MPDRRVLAFRRFANWVLRSLFRVLLRVQVTGIENVPSDGGFIAMMNHIFFVDPVLVSVFAPRLIIIMSKIENYHIPLLGPILHLYGTFAVHRGQMDLQAIRTSLTVLHSGLGLLIAPEGTRSRTRSLQEAREGLASLALRSGAPIVPVGISGQERLWANLIRLRRTPVQITFGEAFRAQADRSESRRDQLRHVTTEAMVRLAAVLPDEYRGVYAEPAARRAGAAQPAQAGSTTE